MMLDTSYIVDLLREQASGRPGPAARFLQDHRASKLRMPVFVLCELQLGVLRGRNTQDAHAAVEQLAEFIEPVYPSAGFAPAYAMIVASLLQAGTQIPTMDALIGSMAVVHSEPIVTADVEHFSRIKNLVVLHYRE